MKEIELTAKTAADKAKMEVQVQQRKQVEYQLLGSLKPKNGHTIWEVNTETGAIFPAEYKKEAAVFGAKIPPKKLIVNPDCVYIPALNEENAKRKYLQNKNQSYYYTKPPKMALSDIL